MRPGLDKEAVRFQVVSEGERGLLGVGYEPARVIASVEEGSAPAREPHAPTGAREGESDDAARLRELVERIAYEIGVRCTVEIEETDDEIRVVCDGDELGTPDRPPRSDDRRDPVPRERDRLPRPLRGAQAAGRRRGRVPRSAPGDSRRPGDSHGRAGPRPRGSASSWSR